VIRRTAEDAGCGEDCEDPSCVFWAGEADQGDLPGAERLPESGPEGDPDGATEFRYERESPPLPKIGPWHDQLEGLLAVDEGKPAREQLTLIWIFETLRGLGYDDSYDAVRRYARTWRKQRSVATAEAYVPLSFVSGEAYQFDWSHEIVVMNGVTVTVKVAHVRLCHSRMLFVRAYSREPSAGRLRSMPMPTGS
jgi:hypothetical protein